MEKDLVDKKLGDKAEVKVSFVDGKLVAEVTYAASLVEGGVVLKVPAANVLDALAAAIPGHFDDAILGAAKELLTKV
jgi:hypothetical protein